MATNFFARQHQVEPPRQEVQVRQQPAKRTKPLDLDSCSCMLFWARLLMWATRNSADR